MKIPWVTIFMLELTGSVYPPSTSCSSDCQSCTDDGSCKICPLNGRCILCPNNCKTCTSINECNHQCKTGFWGSKCELSCEKCEGICYEGICSHDCTTGLYLQEKVCHKCPDNCISCRSGTVCDQCIAGYYGSICQYCRECEQDEDCFWNECYVECTVGSYFNDDVMACFQCPLNCISCTNDTFCLQCQPGFLGTACEHDCTPCPGYCSKETGCYGQCTPGYYLNKTECVNCPTECLSCMNETHCITCQDDRFGRRCQYPCRGCETTCNKDTGCTGLCLTGYFINEYHALLSSSSRLAVTVCEECPEGCTSCISTSECDECQDGRWGKACQQPCNTECFQNRCHKESGVCFGAPCNLGNCNKCDNNYNCISCQDRFYVDINHTCQECPKTCKTGTVCSEKYGNCLKGCNAGWSGMKCDKRCNTGCFQCDQSNKSLCRTCEKGLFGQNCETKCGIKCRLVIGEDNICERENGKCLWGCQSTWWGTLCNKRCSAFCNGTECNSDSGACKHGCIEGYTGTHCKTEQSLEATGNDIENGDGGILIGVGASCGLFVLVAVTGVIIYIMLKKRRKSPTQDSSHDIPLSKQTAKSTAKSLNHQTYEDLDETQKVETEYDGLDKDAYYIYIDDNTSKLHAASADEYTSVSENDLSEAHICKSDKENVSERSLRSTHEITDNLSSKSNQIAINQSKENSCNSHSRNNQHDDPRTETCHDYLVLDECNDEPVKVQNNVYEYLESSSSPDYNVLDSAQKETADLKITEMTCLDRTAESTYHILEPTPKEQMYEPEVHGHEEANDVSESTYHILEPITNEPSCAPDVSHSGENAVESESPYHILEPITIKNSSASDVPWNEVTTAGTESTYHILEPISNEQNAPMHEETVVDTESTYHILEPITNENSNAPDTDLQA